MSSSDGQWPPNGNNGWPGAPSAPATGGAFAQAAPPSPFAQPPTAQPAPDAWAQQQQPAWATPSGAQPNGWPPAPSPQMQQPQQQPGFAPAPWPGAQPNNAIQPFAPQGQGLAVAMAPGGGAQLVLGVPLEPGERVIHFHKPSYTGDKIALWVLGVLTLIAVVGVAFIVWALLYDKLQPKGYFVTNRRVVSVDKRGTPVSIPLHDITDLEAVRNSSQAYGGGLLGAAIGAIADHMTNKNAKADPKYWKRSVAVVLVTRQGTRVNVPSRKASDLGLFLINTLSVPGAAEQAPPVPVAA